MQKITAIFATLILSISSIPGSLNQGGSLMFSLYGALFIFASGVLSVLFTPWILRRIKNGSKSGRIIHTEGRGLNRYVIIRCHFGYRIASTHRPQIWALSEYSARVKLDRILYGHAIEPRPPTGKDAHAKLLNEEKRLRKARKDRRTCHRRRSGNNLAAAARLELQR